MSKEKQELYIDLNDRKIRKADLDAHMILVKTSTEKFKTPVAWKKIDGGFTRVVEK